MTNRFLARNVSAVYVRVIATPSGEVDLRIKHHQVLLRGAGSGRSAMRSAWCPPRLAGTMFISYEGALYPFHPSGNPSSSQADIELTTKMMAGGKLLEIQILDHVVLIQEAYYSFADEPPLGLHHDYLWCFF